MRSYRTRFRMSAPTQDTASPTVRIDVWLWAARFFKTRSLARAAVDNGKVSVNGQRPKPSRNVRIGDAMEVERAGELYSIEVLGLSDTRGAAPVAQSLYSESDASRKAREDKRADARAAAQGYQAPEGRPNKRARRLIRALGDLDAL